MNLTFDLDTKIARLPEIEAVLFDVDGTLIHLEHSYVAGLVGKVVAALGLENSDEFTRKFWYEGDRSNTIKEYLGVKPKDFWDYLDHFDCDIKRQNFTQAYEDINVVAAINERYKTAVISAAPQKFLEHNLQVLAESEVNFSIAYSANPRHGRKPKPDPESFHTVLEILNVKPENAMYVGNGKEDVLGARNAGLSSALILRGEHSVPEPRADITITSLYGLQSVLKFPINL